MGRARDAWNALTRKSTPTPPTPPKQADAPAKPQGGEVGFTGTQIFAGLPFVEYNPDLAFPQSAKVYDEMRRSDGQIKAVLAAVKLPIRSTKWYVEPEQDADDEKLAQEIADFVQHNLLDGGMKYSWDDFLREALTMLDFGFSVFERVYRFDSYNGKPVVMLDKYAPRIASSIWRFPQDEKYNIVAVQQMNWMTGQCVDIPLEKCRVFTYEREGDNITGISILRPAYKHWYIKDALYKIVSVGIEKTLMGTPYAELPEGISSKDKDEILDALAESRVSSDSAITVPKGVVLGMLEGKKSPMDAMPFIEHHDTLIARSVLAQFLNLGTMSSASGGAYALGREMVDMFVMGLEAIACAVQHEVQKDIKDLVVWNFGPDAPVPRLKHKDITFRDMGQLADALGKLGSGGIVTTDADLENQIRDIFGLSPIPEDALKARKEMEANPPVPPTPPASPQPPEEEVTPPKGAPPQKVDPSKPKQKPPVQVAATEGTHIFSEGSVCSCGQVHKFNDPTEKRWRRDLTAYEQIVKFDDLNDKWDQAEEALVKQMREVLSKASDTLQKQITQIANDTTKTQNQKMQAINALEMRYSSQYEAAMKSQIMELFKFGQQQAAQELGVDPNDIPAAGASAAVLSAKASALTDLQFQKAASAIKLAAIQGLSKNQSEKQLNFTMKKASDNYLHGPDLKTSATITVSDAINVGRGSSAEKAGIQGAQWSAVLDNKTCPLCEELDGKVISAHDPDFDAFQPPLHNGCRCIWVFIGSKETNVTFDWETPSGNMLKRYAHLL